MTPEQCRAARARTGWRQDQLALAAGVAEQTVKDFESGARRPRPGTLIALRRAFRQAEAVFATA